MGEEEEDKVENEMRRGEEEGEGQGEERGESPCQLNAKIKTAKISSGRETGFSRKFGPAKISHYTVLHYTTEKMKEQPGI